MESTSTTKNDRNYSGLKITDSISMSLPNKKSPADYIPLIAIGTLGCFGTLNSFVTMFHISVNLLRLNLFAAAFILLFSLLFTNRKSIAIPLIPTIVVYEVILYKKWDDYMDGLMLTCNQVYSRIFPDRGSFFRLEVTNAQLVRDVSTFMIFTSFILVMIVLCITIVWPDFFFGFIFTFAPVEIGLYHGKSPSLLPAFILIVYWASLLAVSSSGYYRSAKRSKTGFLRKGRAFFSKPSVHFRTAAQSGLIMLLCAAFLISGIFVGVNYSGWTRPDKVNSMRRDVKTAVSEFDYDDIGGSLQRISASFGIGTPKARDHDLSSEGSISFTGKNDLTLTVKANENHTPDYNVYLKGYVGSVYDGKSWEKLPKSIYEKNDSLFQSFKDSVFPQDLLHHNTFRLAFGFSYDNIAHGSSDDEMSFLIESHRLENKYCYVPYNSVPKGSVKYIGDTNVECVNKDKYSFFTSNIQFYDNFYKDGNLEDYSPYRDFVYENYLDVPNNNDTRKLYDLYIGGGTYSNTYKQLKYIKKILSDNASYTLEPGRTPPERDFVNYFLTENHKGYCVHFATAGVVLARLSGIPARYVEGYVALKNDFTDKNFKSTGEYKIQLKDERAHAWAEIYIDGLGWIPYEFTPPSAAALRGSGSDDVQIPQISMTLPQLNITSPSTSPTVVSTSVSLSVSGSDNHGTSKDGSNSLLSLWNGLSYRGKISAAFSLAFVIILIVIIVVHLVVTKKREKSLHTPSNSQNALNAYNYVVKLLEFCDISRGNMQYLEFARFAENDDKRIFKPGDLTEVTDIALEAGLSGQEISDERARKAVIISYRTALSVFRKQNLLTRFYMKFIRNLC